VMEAEVEQLAGKRSQPNPPTEHLPLGN
jgi:hypothetical protein